MGAAIELRADFDGATLSSLARTTRNASRRLLALAEIYDGGRRGDATRIGGMGLQIVRDRVIRVNDRGPDGLIDGKAPGRQPKLHDVRASGACGDRGERSDAEGPWGVCWRQSGLAQWLHAEFAVALVEATVSRELRKPRCQAQGAAHPPDRRAEASCRRWRWSPAWIESDLRPTTMQVRNCPASSRAKMSPSCSCNSVPSLNANGQKRHNRARYSSPYRAISTQLSHPAITPSSSTSSSG